MAVPKKRTGHSAQGHRRANWKAAKPETTKCLNCGELVLTHTVCTACGYYKGKAVSIKSPDYSETTIEPKKPAKKTSTKKAEAKTEEVKSKKQKVNSEVETVETVKADETNEIVEEVKTEETKSE
jgi:large subunit ribosomal protein L32